MYLKGLVKDQGPISGKATQSKPQSGTPAHPECLGISSSGSVQYNDLPETGSPILPLPTFVEESAHHQEWWGSEGGGHAGTPVPAAVQSPPVTEAGREVACAATMPADGSLQSKTVPTSTHAPVRLLINVVEKSVVAPTLLSESPDSYLCICCTEAEWPFDALKAEISASEAEIALVRGLRAQR